MARPVSNKYRLTHFARALRRFRLEREWTQAELAHRTGISQQAIAFYERGYPNRRPKYEHTVIFAAHFECNPWDLDPDLLAVVPPDLQELADRWRHLPERTRRELGAVLQKVLRRYAQTA